MTFTGVIGTICMFPLRAIIAACVALRIHPNILTLVGVIVNVGAAWALGFGRFVLAGVIMILANIFDFIDGKVAHQLKLESGFGAFWDSTLDRFSDLALLVGLIYLYSKLGRSDYVMVAALTLIFSIMTSYARARAESLVDKCKVGFMERPERIVLLMIGAFTNRMAGVLWVVLTLSILAVVNRIYYTYLALNGLPMPARQGVIGFLNRALFWTDERTTLPYDVWVIAILAFVWLVPPDWLNDPTASGLLSFTNGQSLTTDTLSTVGDMTLTTRSNGDMTTRSSGDLMIWGALTAPGTLTLNSDATYTYIFKAKRNKAHTDLVIANGVTINGATLSLSGQTQGRLRQGLVLTVISNTSANPISGTFSNLPDGGIITINGINFEASYEGGDGNDLTLTVVP